MLVPDFTEIYPKVANVYYEKLKRKEEGIIIFFGRRTGNMR